MNLDSHVLHPTAIIHPSARIGANVAIGPYCVVGEHVTLGDGAELVSHVTVDGRTEIGAGTRICPFSSIGHIPQYTNWLPLLGILSYTHTAMVLWTPFRLT